MERFEFDPQFSRLKALKTRKAEIDPELIGAYWAGLRNYPISLFTDAITKILQDDKSFPKVPRIKQVLAGLDRFAGVRFATMASPYQSFHCGQCDVGFSAILSRDPREIVYCAGDGVSTCGRKWNIGELNAHLLDSRERQQDIPIL